MAGRKGDGSYGISATPFLVLAQLFAVAAITLMLVWILHFEGGLSLKSKDLARLLNAHHVLMLFGPVICVGEAIMAFKTIPARRKARKIVHMLLNLAAFVLGVLGLYAVFTVLHKDGGLPDFDSLHSWIGFGTMCLLFLQFLVGFTCFLFPGSTSAMRARVRPWHAVFGIVIFLLAVCSAATGFTGRFWLLSLPRGSESYVLNFAGLVTILFGMAVVLSVVIP